MCAFPLSDYSLKSTLLPKSVFGENSVPAAIRDIFNLKKGSTVIFQVTDKGIFFMPSPGRRTQQEL